MDNSLSDSYRILAQLLIQVDMERIDMTHPQRIVLQKQPLTLRPIIVSSYQFLLFKD